MGGTPSSNKGNDRLVGMRPKHQLFRERGEHGHSPVTYIELFFDLVFVFAITQLSHHLLEHLNLHGVLETLILFLAVWWVWIYTSWTTNWLDPDRGNVRLMLIILMLGGLALSSAVPDAFGKTGLLFAGAYVAMQVGRTLYTAWAWHGVSAGGHRNFARIACYFLMSAPLWLWGAFQDSDTRLLAWAGALAIEYAGPVLWFRVPGLGRSTGDDWDISGGHMAERCALFMIIALGEAVLVTGATYADLEHDGPTTWAFVTSFIGSAAMWWIYFDIGAKRASDLIEHAEKGRAGQIARNAYTYIHMPIIASVVVTAVGDEMLLAHPIGHTGLAFVLTACGGPFLFLFGNQMFKWITSDLRWPPLSHFIGMLWLATVGVTGYLQHWQPFSIGMLATGGLLVTVMWEWGSFAGGWQRWTPWAGRVFGGGPKHVA